MQIGERIDERGADGVADLGTIADGGRLLVPDDDAAPALHDVEDRSDERRIVAERVGSRRERIHRMDRRQPPELARHVVRRRRHRTKRRTPQHELGLAEADQVGQVGVPARKLFDRERLCEVEPGDAGVREVLAQPRLDARPVELFGVANRAGSRSAALGSFRDTGPSNSK